MIEITKEETVIIPNMGDPGQSYKEWWQVT